MKISFWTWPNLLKKALLYLAQEDEAFVEEEEFPCEDGEDILREEETLVDPINDGSIDEGHSENHDVMEDETINDEEDPVGETILSHVIFVSSFLNSIIRLVMTLKWKIMVESLQNKDLNNYIHVGGRKWDI